MTKKTLSLLLILAVTLTMLLIPVSAQASNSNYSTYNCNYVLQMMRSDLCKYLSDKGYYNESAVSGAKEKSCSDPYDFFNLYDNSSYFGSNCTDLGSGSCYNNQDCYNYDDENCGSTDCDYSDNSCNVSRNCGTATNGETYYIPTTGRTVSQNVQNAVSRTAVSVPTIVQQVVDLVNEERAKEGLAPLTLDASLCDAAAIRVGEISGKFSHTRPNGETCFTALDEAGVNYIQAGENIALGQRTAQEVMQDWMNSPGHRANIMSTKYSRIGVAVTQSTDARYNGYAWAQEFAN